jgi:hypothetical protein
MIQEATRSKVIEVDQRIYRSMIGGLLYLTATRPDIMHDAFLVAIFQEDPKETHVVLKEHSDI